ncbi:roadblock/LC7 domain-containing protein [Polaromonas sp. SM01]|uniref:roadblock/LC7 domain-containing protein n=1 Tax=Polaromonas sp. SM01 TaxID=3085630 RepID=UPI002980F8F0|nr:roadblock/LC7 domain-containing protein [Polaromonas sp. SM01]MDW5441180.1 roadblock/LC7 domain-containing protein [Polaromonas sp. SM01]
MTLPPHLTTLAENALKSLMRQVHGAVAAVVSTADGFDLASRVENASDGAKLAAMASSIAAICSVVGEESQVGAHESISIESENGYVVMIHVAHAVYPMILSVVANKNAVLAQMVYFTKQTAQQLGEAP